MWFIFFISIKIINKKENKREEKKEKFKYFERYNIRKYYNKEEY